MKNKTSLSGTWVGNSAYVGLSGTSVPNGIMGPSGMVGNSGVRGLITGLIDMAGPSGLPN